MKGGVDEVVQSEGKELGHVLQSSFVWRSDDTKVKIEKKRQTKSFTNQTVSKW